MYSVIRFQSSNSSKFNEFLKNFKKFEIKNGSNLIGSEKIVSLTISDSHPWSKHRKYLKRYLKRKEKVLTDAKNKKIIIQIDVGIDFEDFSKNSITCFLLDTEIMTIFLKYNISFMYSIYFNKD